MWFLWSEYVCSPKGSYVGGLVLRVEGHNGGRGSLVGGNWTSFSECVRELSMYPGSVLEKNCCYKRASLGLER